MVRYLCELEMVWNCVCERVICVRESTAKGSWCFCTWCWRKLQDILRHHTHTYCIHINSKYSKSMTKLEARKIFNWTTDCRTTSSYQMILTQLSVSIPVQSLLSLLSFHLPRCLHFLSFTSSSLSLFPVLSLSSFVCCLIFQSGPDPQLSLHSLDYTIACNCIKKKKTHAHTLWKLQTFLSDDSLR